jgi:hypothetical protein
MMFELRPAPKPKARAKKVCRPMKKSRMKSYNAKRKGSAFPKRRNPEYCAWIREQPCILSGRKRAEIPGELIGHAWHPTFCGFIGGPVQVCHVKTRGAGGNDLGNVLPMCAGAHDEQHCIGIPAFQKRWGINLAKIAAGLGLLYSEGG